MKPERYQKTDLEIVNITELDGEYSPEKNERNILREKTFNKELNSLVSQIFNNEKKSSFDLPREDFTDHSTGFSILEQCEKLIYKIKHTDEYMSISSVYNPFETDINVYDDIDDTSDYVKAGLMQSCHPEYQILTYNFRDRAYRSNINYLDESYSSDIYFSIKDPVIKRLNENIEGYIITSQLISNDIFFSKKFLNRDSEAGSTDNYYIIKISSLFDDFIRDRTLSNRISKFEVFLSPLLLVKLNRNDDLNLSEIYNKIRKTSAIPLLLFFLKNSAQRISTDYSYEDILIKMELFIKSSINSKLKSYIFTLKDYSDKENIFLFKFFLSKIKRIFKKNSMLLRTGINRAILMTSDFQYDKIEPDIERINSGNNLITINDIGDSSLCDNSDFINLFL